MTYTAFSAAGPRIALAISDDLFSWQRLGLARFWRDDGIELDDLDDKDASLFPVAVPNPSGQLELAILHRPLFAGTRPEETARHPEPPPGGPRPREHLDSYSYSPMALEGDGGPYHLGRVQLPSPPGRPGVALGAAQDRRRYPSCPDPPWLACRSITV